MRRAALRDDARYCAAAEQHDRLAILGVFTAEDHVTRRAVARTWLSPDAGFSRARDGILARFVARGLGGTPVLDREAQEFGDVILLRGPTTMLRTNGPLLTLILWFECAVQAWPRATLIGKADDDVWVHVDGTAAHLRGSLEALRSVQTPAEGEAPQMFWGLMETYGWSLTTHRPMGFGYKYSRGAPNCTVRPIPSMREKVNHSLLYPVHFAKGPMYFVSTPLIRQLVADPEVRSYALTVIASANSTHREKTLPWEDVYTGLALVRTARGGSPAFVHMGSRVISEGYGAYAKMGFGANTLLFHANTEKARDKERYAKMHRWALANHCNPGTPANLTLRCNHYRPMISCAGVTWRRCLYIHDYGACPGNGPMFGKPVNKTRTAESAVVHGPTSAMRSKSRKPLARGRKPDGSP